MHILATVQTSFDDIVAPVDLGQTQGDIAVLSFADSDLASLAAAWGADKAALPRVRLAHLRDLRHPMSVDLWVERVGVHAKVILVRLIGGLDWWRYGVERLSAVARERGIALAVLPGEDRDDPRLAEASTLPADELAVLLRYFREGGLENLRGLLGRLARHYGERSGGERFEVREPQPLPRCAGYLPGVGAVDLDRLAASLPGGRPVVPVIFYRALLLAADTAAIDALCDALEAHGLAPAPLVITSLKEPAAADFVRGALARLAPAAIVTTTAFASGEPGEPTPLDGPGVPVFQAVLATTKRSRMARRRARTRRGRSCDACRAPRARWAGARRRRQHSRMRCPRSKASPSPPLPIARRRTASWPSPRAWRPRCALLQRLAKSAASRC